MPRHVGIGPVDHRLVKAGPGDPGLEVVADRLTGDAAEISKDADMRGDPIRQLLAPHRLGVGEVRGPEDGDKDLRRDDFAGKTIDHLAGSAGEIDKQFLAGEVGSGASSVSAGLPKRGTGRRTRNSQSRRARRRGTPPTAAPGRNAMRKKRHEAAYLSSHTSSRRLPLKMLVTMIVSPLT
jgi:hypothetical protein